MFRLYKHFPDLTELTRPYKKDTFVLDFFNKAEEIKEAFKDYYSTTILSEATDINKLNDLRITWKTFMYMKMKT